MKISAAMRILFCAAGAPLPPLNGARLQLRHLCTELAKRHEICVLAYRWPDQEGDAPAGVEVLSLPPPARSGAARAWILARALARAEPPAATALTGVMSSAIRELLGRRSFDVAQVAGSAMAAVAPALEPLPAVLGPVDTWHLNVAAAATLEGSRKARLRRRLNERLVRRFVGTAYRPYRRVVAVSPEDARILGTLDPTVRFEVVPNGVDVEYFAPSPAVAPDPGLVVFVGAMQWAPNVQAAQWLVHSVLPLVRAERPDARVAIVGRQPSTEVLSMAALDGVEVTGEVPDVRPWVWRAQAFACPMVSGTGIKNKLLEALACGAPCVATSLACQGVDVSDDEDVLVADSAERFAAAVVALLDDAQLRARLGAAGRALAVERYSWEGAARGYERVYELALREATA
jgi:glycosyltransferase involved in cell wall biosynthesis